MEKILEILFTLICFGSAVFVFVIHKRRLVSEKNHLIHGLNIKFSDIGRG